MEEKNVNTWEEFAQALADLRREHLDAGLHASSAPLFRGQENSRWMLSTTLDRIREGMLFSDYYRRIAKIRPQIESLTNRDWPIPGYPEVERLSRNYQELDQLLWVGPRPAYAYMAYLRHHGFPSPLLDWTRSPYIAAYFAFKNVGENSGGMVSIFVYFETPNKPSGNGKRVLYRYGPYVKTHRRHVLQQSEYTLCLAFDNEWRFEEYDKVFDSGLDQQGICWKFTIPASQRRKVLQMLDEYNLNAFSLFESEDAMIETLATREFSFENSGRAESQVQAQRALSRIRSEAAQRGLERLSSSDIDAEIQAVRVRGDQPARP